MTDDERLARLTKLAQKAWPEHALAVEPGYGKHAWQVGGDGGVSAWIDHPRALDALEAALLVLNSPDGREAAMFDSGRRFAQAMAKYTWIEPLAERFERYAANYERTGTEIGLKLAEEYRGHAAELRKRAEDGR